MLSKIFDLTGKRIYVTGHRGMVGSAIVRRLGTCGCDVITASRDEVDLERQEQAERFLVATRPDVVVVAAGRGVTLDFSRPGKPTDNAFIESFNGKFRAECLNAHWFMSLDDARRKCES